VGTPQIAAQDAGERLPGKALGQRRCLGQPALAQRCVGWLQNAGGIERRFPVSHQQDRHVRVILREPGPCARPAHLGGAGARRQASSRATVGRQRISGTEVAMLVFRNAADCAARLAASGAGALAVADGGT
jgi:hypothetical protein